ncbi:MAG: SDR family oxidoreductase [Candidatus Pacebacteria bacterium]|nr:SDR family oxidoreductase [Candidatus Paceibacterota bacterium]
MKTLLTTGLNGLVGSKFAEDFKNSYQFDNLDLRDPSQPTDITKYDQVLAKFQQSDATHIIHLAAYTDVTGAWQQTDDTNGIAYQVNVVGTENVVKAAEATGKHLIYVSTAYVFDGEKKELYTETDSPNPIEWYGKTKFLAEEIVKKAQCPWTILRIDQPFRSDEFEKVDTAHRIINGIKAGSLYPQFTNHYFGPTFVDDFAKVLDFTVRTSPTGIYHASSGESWTDYDFAVAINEALNLGAEIGKGDLEAYLASSARPYQRNTAMSNQKLLAILDFEPKTIKQALSEIK